jgi:hypothetical protein
MEGYRFREECLRMSDIPRPKATPSAMDTLNESRKIPMPLNTELIKISSVPWNCVNVLCAAQQKKHNRNKRRHALVHDDTDSIVQQTLPKDNGVQFWVDFVLIENGKDGDWVRGG